MIIWRAQSFLGWIVPQTLNRAAYCDNALPLWLECTHGRKHTCFSAQLCSQQHTHTVGTKIYFFHALSRDATHTLTGNAELVATGSGLLIRQNGALQSSDTRR